MMYAYVSGTNDACIQVSGMMYQVSRTMMYAYVSGINDACIQVSGMMYAYRLVA